VDELIGERRFARARFAGDEYDLCMAGSSHLQGVLEALQLGLSTDKHFDSPRAIRSRNKI
jgi:hypothetical protein